jgi:hypothetical protein
MVKFEVGMSRKQLPKAAKDAAPEAKRHTWEQRKKFLSNISVYRDLAEWLTDIGTEETRLAKKDGIIAGKKKIGTARVIDALLRPWAWRRLWELRHPDRPTSECPPPPPPPDAPLPSSS